MKGGRATDAEEVRALIPQNAVNNEFLKINYPT